MNDDRTLKFLDEILDEMPHLANLGWTVKNLAVICRMKIIIGHLDPATKEYKTSIASVKRVLEHRKNELIIDALESISEDD